MGLQKTTTLVAVAEHNVNVYKSARNIQGVSVSPLDGLNALNVLTPRKMLFTRDALEALKSRAAVDSKAAMDSDASAETSETSN